MKMEETPFIFGLQINVMKNFAWENHLEGQASQASGTKCHQTIIQNISKYPSITTGSTWQV